MSRPVCFLNVVVLDKFRNHLLIFWSSFRECRIIISHSIYSLSYFAIFILVNSLKYFLASFQFFALMQYFILGSSKLPCISPAFFNSAICCETVESARGISFETSLKQQLSRDARCRRMAILAGCDNALANPASNMSSFEYLPLNDEAIICVRIISNHECIPVTPYTMQLIWPDSISCYYEYKQKAQAIQISRRDKYSDRCRIPAV